MCSNPVIFAILQICEDSETSTFAHLDASHPRRIVLALGGQVHFAEYQALQVLTKYVKQSIFATVKMPFGVLSKTNWV